MQHFTVPIIYLPCSIRNNFVPYVYLGSFLIFLIPLPLGVLIRSVCTMLFHSVTVSHHVWSKKRGRERRERERERVARPSLLYSTPRTKRPAVLSGGRRKAQLSNALTYFVLHTYLLSTTTAMWPQCQCQLAGRTEQKPFPLEPGR